MGNCATCDDPSIYEGRQQEQQKPIRNKKPSNQDNQENY